MKVAWTRKAVGDLARLHEFLAGVNPEGAERTVRSLVEVATKLSGRPRLGARLEQYLPREVRRIFVGKYEVRYEVQEQTVILLRFWHSREDR